MCAVRLKLPRCQAEVDSCRLNSYGVHGRLLSPTEHGRSEVMCVRSVPVVGQPATWLVTGSRDHTIKRYTVEHGKLMILTARQFSPHI